MNDTPKEKGTTYVVLEQMGGNSAWTEHGVVSASSAREAIKKVVAGEGITRGAPFEQLVAVPGRSWKPVKVTVETKQTVKLG